MTTATTLLTLDPRKDADNYSVEGVTFMGHDLRQFQSANVGQHASVYLRDVDRIEVSPATVLHLDAADTHDGQPKFWTALTVRIRTKTGTVTLHVSGHDATDAESAPDIEIANSAY